MWIVDFIGGEVSEEGTNINYNSFILTDVTPPSTCTYTNIVFKRKYFNGKFSLFTFTIVFAFLKWKMHMAENVFGN